jgi:hypothetical protein
MKKNGSFLTLRELAAIRACIGGESIARTARNDGQFSERAVKVLMNKLNKGYRRFTMLKDYP